MYQVCYNKPSLSVYFFVETACIAIEVYQTGKLICASKTIIAIDQAWSDNDRCGHSPPLSSSTSLTAAVVTFCKRNSTCAVPILKGSNKYVNIKFHCEDLQGTITSKGTSAQTSKIATSISTTLFPNGNEQKSTRFDSYSKQSITSAQTENLYKLVTTDSRIDAQNSEMCVDIPGDSKKEHFLSSEYRISL
ncbi:unnamed protein product [Mytilus edulis]|uniref:Uncharacterized protein n=1 Tax=Mytilus edulis TaxID=6550 RepID=A0A8S3VQM6_MYTED|nr:unnamed protein product [Mytilus edulis]